METIALIESVDQLFDNQPSNEIHCWWLTRDEDHGVNARLSVSHYVVGTMTVMIGGSKLRDGVKVTSWTGGMIV